jgi:hypothetical protein
MWSAPDFGSGFDLADNEPRRVGGYQVELAEATRHPRTRPRDPAARAAARPRLPERQRDRPARADWTASPCRLPRLWMPIAIHRDRGRLRAVPPGCLNLGAR